MAEAVAARQPAQTRVDPQRADSAAARQRSGRTRPGVSQLQQAVGNRAMYQLLRSTTVQPKLTVSPPDDEYEREADRVAADVLRMAAPEPEVARPEATSPGTAVGRAAEPIQRMCPECEKEEEEVQRAPAITPLRGTPSVNRMCADCEEATREEPAPTEAVQPMAGEREEEEEEPLVQPQTAGEGTPAVSPNFERYLEDTRGGGQPLPASTLAFFEPRFGQDFSRVRVHADERADRAASEINALAFTKGSDVTFRSGRYQPGTADGDRLIAHELTHVVQQTGGVHRRCAACGNELHREPAPAVRRAPQQVSRTCARCEQETQRRSFSGSGAPVATGQEEEREEEEAIVQAKAAAADPPDGQPPTGAGVTPARRVAPSISRGPDVARLQRSPGANDGSAAVAVSPPDRAEHGAGLVRLGARDDASGSVRRQIDPFNVVSALLPLARNRTVELQGHQKFEPDFIVATYIAAVGANGQEVPVNVRFGSLASGRVQVRWHADTGTYEIAPTLLPMRHPGFVVDEARDSLALGFRVLKSDSSILGLMGFLPGLPPDRLKHISGHVGILLRQENMFKAILGEDYERGELDVAVYSNEIDSAGSLRVSFGGLLTVGGGQKMAIGFAVVDGAHHFAGELKVQAKGLLPQEIAVERSASGALSAESDGLTVSQEWALRGIGKASLTASYVNGLLQIRGEASIQTDRVSGDLTLLVTDEDLAWAAVTEELAVLGPFDPAAAGRAASPGDGGGLAVTGWGALDVSIIRDAKGKDLLTGHAGFVVDPDGYITVKGTVRTAETKFTLIEAKPTDWREHFTTGVWKAYLTPRWLPGGDLKVSAEGGLSSRYTLGPVTLYDIKAEGVYSNNPAIASELSLSGRLNGSAELQGRVGITGSVAARLGSRFEPFGIDVITLALGLHGIGTLKGYVDVEPTIGIRQAPGAPSLTSGTPEYFVKGTLDVGGELDVELGGSIKFEVVAAGWEKTVTFVKRPIAGFGMTFELDHTFGQDSLPSVKVKTGDFKRQLFVKAVLHERKVTETDELKGGYSEEGKEIADVTGTETPITELPPPERVTLRDDFPMAGKYHELILELGAPGDPVVLLMATDPELLISKIEVTKSVLTAAFAVLDSDEKKELEQQLRDLDRIRSAAQRLIAAATKLGVDPMKKGKTRIPGFTELGDLISEYGDRYDETDIEPTLPEDEPSPGTRENPFELVWPKPPTKDYEPLYLGGRLSDPRSQSVLKGIHTKGLNDETGNPVKKYTPHVGGTLPGGETIGISSAFQIYKGRVIGPLSEETTPGGEKLNRILRRYGYSPTAEETEADHVQEIQFGGPDAVPNMWMLDETINGSAGPTLQGASVTYPKTGRSVKLSELKTRTKNYFFRITDFNY